MGKICSCNFINNEKNEEFNGFAKNIKNQNDYIYILKRQFNNYEEKDKKYYGKTSDYDNLVENTSIQDIQVDNEPKEDENRSIKVIHW